MGWNPYLRLELCKPVKGDKKGRYKSFVEAAVGMGGRFGVSRWAPQGLNYIHSSPIKLTVASTSFTNKASLKKFCRVARGRT
ncbi:MAG: hypothetical protein K2W94_05615 [Alphaproteobacteria bacterium]|nr:hypothetical protein [Alphaproteobacteria bacterium]